MTRTAPIVALIALAACAQTKAPPFRADLIADVPTEACGDTRVADLMGKRWNESMRAATLKRSGAKTLRVIAPGMAITMDYRSNRLNLETDAGGKITRIKCG